MWFALFACGGKKMCASIFLFTLGLTEKEKYKVLKVFKIISVFKWKGQYN